LDELEIPSDLAAINVRQDQIAEIAQKAFTDTAITTNPVPITVCKIESLLCQAFSSAR
jgi:alcohol dehydrogenase class IV